MKAEGILQDAATEYPSRAMYLHYASYAVNNYLLACRLLNRTPAFDLVNFILSATSGMGAFKEVDFAFPKAAGVLPIPSPLRCFRCFFQTGHQRYRQQAVCWIN